MISQPCYERFSCTHYYCTVYYPLTESDTSTTVLNEFPPTRFFAKKKKKCWKKKLPPPDLFDPQKSLWYMDEKS